LVRLREGKIRWWGEKNLASLVKGEGKEFTNVNSLDELRSNSSDALQRWWDSVFHSNGQG
jgi:hypothetical protein